MHAPQSSHCTCARAAATAIRQLGHKTRGGYDGPRVSALAYDYSRRVLSLDVVRQRFPFNLGDRGGCCHRCAESRRGEVAAADACIGEQSTQARGVGNMLVTRGAPSDACADRSLRVLQ